MLESPSIWRFSHLRLNVKLSFPGDYPSQPPRLRLFTPLPHPNVFSGGWVCLDMLRYVFDDSKSGWCPAYSVQSILLQLQTFLTAENIPQDHGGSTRQINAVDKVDEAKWKIDSFKCTDCNHCYEDPFPPLPPPEMVTVLDFVLTISGPDWRCSCHP